MQKLNTLWQMVSAASTVRELAQQSKTYHFVVKGEFTFYLQAENASVEISRWERPQVEVTVKLQAPFGWRVAAEQDELGVYVAAKRRAVVGSIASAYFDVKLPYEAYLALNLDGGSLHLHDIQGKLNIAPPEK